MVQTDFKHQEQSRKLTTIIFTSYADKICCSWSNIFKTKKIL